MKTPTIGDLLRLLTSDTNAEEWMSDAIELTQHGPGEEPADDISWRIDIIIGEMSNQLTSIEEDSGRAEIDSNAIGRLSETAKRGAVMLLHAAWAAESELARTKANNEAASETMFSPHEVRR